MQLWATNNQRQWIMINLILTVSLILLLSAALISIPLRLDSQAATQNEEENKNPSFQPIQTIDSPEKIEVYGVLRPNENGVWYVVDDRGHTPNGIKEVTQGHKKLMIYFEEQINDKHWGVVTPDETLTIHDVDVGMSVRDYAAIIYFAEDGKMKAPAEFNYKGANLWFYVTGDRNAELERPL